VSVTVHVEGGLAPMAAARDAHARVRLIGDLEEIEAIRPVWEAAAVGRHDADIDFYLAFARSRERFVRPYVLLGERDGALESMLIARVEDVELPAKVGYAKVFSARLRSITVVHGGLVGVTEETAQALLGRIRQSLARGEADVLTLPAQPAGSPLLRAALESLPAFRRAAMGEPATHRTLALPGSYDEFLRSRSKSTRESVKRYRKKVERELGDRLDLRTYREPEDLDRIFADTEPVAAKTYQRGLGVALADSSDQRALIEVGLRRGWFRTYVVYLDGDPIAFWPGYLHRGTFHIGTPGYDPAYADYRIGTYLQMRMIEELCAEPGVHTVDYGFGDAEYKRRFGSDSWEESGVLVFAPRPRALAVNAACSAVHAVASAARAAMSRAGVLDRFKQGWRRRLARQSAEGAT
jgi:CelD/BcsL family acetyltransferase involved in cellulose biosynthesis